MTKPLPTASEAAAGLWRRIGRPVKLAFTAAFAAGLLVYLFALTHQVFCTGDALNNYTFNGDLSWMGRWSCRWLSALGTEANMPAVNGLLMILALSLMAAVTASLLQVRSALCALLLGAVMMCHPAAGATLQYLHNADGYMIAALLSVAALWLTDRYRWGFLPGSVLLCLSMGTYQAYLALIVALMLVRGASLLADGHSSLKTLLLRILRYGLLAALGISLYYGVTKLLAALGMQLSEYQSVGSMGQFTAAQLLENFLGCFRDFKQSITFLSFRPGYYVNGYLNYALFAAGWGMMWLLMFTGGKGCPLLPRIVLMAVLTLLSPMLYCAIRMANPQYVHQLMTYSTVGMYLLAIAGVELIQRRRAGDGTTDGEKAAVTVAADAGCAASDEAIAEADPVDVDKAAIDVSPAEAERPPASADVAEPGLFHRLRDLAMWLYSWAAPMALAICVLVWSVGSNLDFYRGHEDYQNLYAQCSVYLSMAEQTEGYEKHMPIYVVGQPDEDSPMSRTRPGLNEVKNYYAFMVHVLKVQMPYGVSNEIDAAAQERAQTDAFRAMPSYPQPGCVQVIDGAVVVKLGDSGQS